MPVTETSPGLTIVDQTTERADLAKRAEVKYAMSAVDLQKLRTHLAGNCRQLIHNNRVSVVRSIYFDDASLSACRANLDGISSRRKLRIRWYDTLLPQREVYFEIKWRENRVTGKHRLQIQFDEALHKLSYSEITRRLEQALPEEHRCQLLRYPEPTTIVQYNREHFSSDDGSLRVTLDYDLTFYDQMGRENISTDFACRLEDLAVIEGKVPVGRDADLRRLLYPFVPQANRCSKYVHGCRLLGHIRGAE